MNGAYGQEQTGLTYRIVAVVCHPDDEALWIGGLIHALSKFSRVEVNVICLSGKDENSARQSEFMQAQGVAGYQRGVVLGGGLRLATEPLPPIEKTLEAGLNLFDIPAKEISLLLTHSPFGEEHMHPHHQQTFTELREWTLLHDVPFGYFSCLPIPVGALQPQLVSMRRKGAMHVINFSRCSYTLLDRLSSYLSGTRNLLPKYYLQFLVDMVAKQAMLNCYQSINIEQHQEGYAMFTSNCESIYLFDDRGLQPFNYVMSEMSVPGCPNLFLNFQQTGRLSAFVKRVMNRIT